jgi:hypothetical protein
MVSLAVHTFGQAPVTCNARPLLFAAHASLERGDIIAAGCKLREGIRVWLHAECTYYDCLPKVRGNKPIPPRVLAKALRKSGELGPDIHEWIVEAVDVGNKAAHLEGVRPSLIACCLDLIHSLLDHSTYLQSPFADGRLA